jgi:myotubularin-related protein 6/7/8
MPHHIVFSYLPSKPANAPPDAKPPRQKEVWITYPMINYCCLKSCPPVMRQQPSIRIRCRDFTFFAFFFPDEKKARDVYDSIRALSCKIGRLDKLLAFSYQPKPPEDQFNSWDIYDARREFKRLGISPKDTEKGWRISEINVEYKVSKLSSVQDEQYGILTQSAVLKDIPRSHRCTFESLGQRSAIRRRIPIETAHTCARLPPPAQ